MFKLLALFVLLFCCSAKAQSYEHYFESLKKQFFLEQESYQEAEIKGDAIVLYERHDTVFSFQDPKHKGTLFEDFKVVAVIPSLKAYIPHILLRQFLKKQSFFLVTQDQGEAMDVLLLNFKKELLERSQKKINPFLLNKYMMAAQMFLMRKEIPFASRERILDRRSETRNYLTIAVRDWLALPQFSFRITDNKVHVTINNLDNKFALVKDIRIKSEH